MTEQTWNTYLHLMAVASDEGPRPCVVCWSEDHQTPFPPQLSSSLCSPHALAMRRAYRRKRRRALYPPNWKTLAHRCRERARFRCESCRVRHGAIRYSKRTGAAYQVWLHAAHVYLHDTLNPLPWLRCLCPTCHARYDWRLRQREARVRLERAKHRRALQGHYRKGVVCGS
jgi:hypothetical protein